MTGLTCVAVMVVEPGIYGGLWAMLGDLVVETGGRALIGLMGSVGPGLMDLPCGTWMEECSPGALAIAAGTWACGEQMEFSWLE